MRKMNKKGFTIVELVIVIAVIAILSAVLIPTFSGVVDNSKKTAAVADAKAAYQQYVAAVTMDGKDADMDMVYKYAEGMYVVIKDGQVYEDANGVGVIEVDTAIAAAKKVFGDSAVTTVDEVSVTAVPAVSTAVSSSGDATR